MRMRFIQSIKAQLFLVIILSMLPPLGIYLYSAWDSRQRAVEDAYKAGKMILQGLAAEHESALAAARQFLFTLSRLPEVRERKPLALRKLFQELLSQNVLYGNIFLLDEKGRNVASAKEMSPDIRLDGRKYFQDAKRTGDFAVGEYVIGAALKRPVFHLAYPVKDERGGFRGVVVVALDAGRFGELFSLAGLPSGSTFCLLDSRATILYHHPASEGLIGQVEQPEAFRQMVQGPVEGHYLAEGPQGRKLFYVYRRFSLRKDDPAYLFLRVGITQKEVMKDARRSLVISGVLLGSAVFLTLLTAWLFASSVIVRRLARLVEVAHALGRGELATRTDLAAEKDELGELVRTLDSMAENLERLERERFLATQREREARLRAEKLAGQTSVIAEIGRIIGSTLEIERVYEPFAAEVGKLIPFDRLAVNLHYPEKDLVVVAYATGMEIAGRDKGASFTFSNSLSQAVAAARKGLLLLPETSREIRDRFPGHLNAVQEGVRSLMAVPLFYRGRVMGSLHFWSKKTKAYGEEDLVIAEWIAGQIGGAIGAAQIFCELQDKEMELRESEAKFRSLFEQAAVGVAELDLRTGKFLTVNSRLCQLLGRTKEELQDTTFQAITHPEDVTLHEEKASQLLAGLIDHFSLEKRYVRGDGEVVWVSIFLSALWGPEEEPGRVMTVVTDITNRKMMEEEIREMSLRDQLTGLYNRRGFMTLAEQQLKTARRSGRTMLLTFIDCDDLKSVNDNLGHEMGDRLLTDTAQFLSRTFREADVIARLGGDEFVVLSIDVPVNVEEMVGRLKEGISAFNAGSDRPYLLSLSWGTALFDPSLPVTVEELLHLADSRMYEQKRGKEAQNRPADAGKAGEGGAR